MTVEKALKQIGALLKERTFFLVKHGECGIDINQAGIGFDLAKIGPEGNLIGLIWRTYISEIKRQPPARVILLEGRSFDMLSLSGLISHK